MCLSLRGVFFFMPVPFIVAGIAIASAITGGVAAAKGYKKVSKARDTNESANEIVEKARKKIEKRSSKAVGIMDEIGKEELNALKSFEKFADLVEKIQNRPEFSDISNDGLKLEEFSLDELKDAAVGATAVISAISTAATGAFAGIAASGATTGLMSMGLSYGGIAATNHVLATIGGGALAAGGGGVALGTTLLSAATAGIGILVGGCIFNFTGNKVLEKAEENYDMALEIKDKAKNICKHLKQLTEVAETFFNTFTKVRSHYNNCLDALSFIIAKHCKGQEKCEYSSFSQDERVIFKNLVLLVRVLFEMCKVKIVLQKEEQEEMHEVNTQEVMSIVQKAKETVQSIS